MAAELAENSLHPCPLLNLPAVATVAVVIAALEFAGKLTARDDDVSKTVLKRLLLWEFPTTAGMLPMIDFNQLNTIAHCHETRSLYIKANNSVSNHQDVGTRSNHVGEVSASSPKLHCANLDVQDTADQLRWLMFTSVSEYSSSLGRPGAQERRQLWRCTSS